jgi:restriction system protein
MATAPTFDELMWPALQALKAVGGSAANEELLNKIIELEQIPPEVQVIEHTDHRQSRLNYNLAWARTYLKKAGAIDNSQRGVWSITKDGEALSKAQVSQIPARVRKQDRLNKSNTDRLDLLEDPTSAQSVEPHDLRWKDQLLDVLRNLKPDALKDWPNGCCAKPGS